MLSMSSGKGQALAPVRDKGLSRVMRRFIFPRRDSAEEQNDGCTPIGQPMTISLHSGKLFTVEVATQCKITCTDGTVWITSQDRSSDYILEAGESLLLRRKGKIIVSGGSRPGAAIQVSCG